MKWMPCCAALALTFTSAFGQDALRKASLTLPSNALERIGMVPVVFRFEHGRSGSGQLSVRWTDSLGRVVLEDTHPITLNDEIQISFPIDLTRAVAMKNTLQATLSLVDSTAKEKPTVEEKATLDFVAKPVEDGFRDYQIIMYQAYPTVQQPALEQLGINAGQYPGHNVKLPDYLIENNMRWYSEQIATEWYAEYHRWRSDRSVDWSLLQAKELYRQDPTSKEAFKRHPSFWDGDWRAKMHDQIVAVTKRNAPYRPLFYSLSDESGIADLGSTWDFDLSDQSLVPMRRWLQSMYGSLQALNAEWETHFADWNLVTPPTTNEAMQRKGENFSGWADFKQWMDLSYVDALHLGVDAVHEVDPTAFVAIVGAQKPGWGGYDYSRLSHAVTAMEPYDIGDSVKLVHSLNPALALLTTGFASGDWERHRTWFELLQGERGLILWDDTHRYLSADGSKGEAGKSAEGYYNEIRNGIGALMINSPGRDDGIAVHYSQPSLRTSWMLERRPDGDAWMKRNADYERANNRFDRLRESWGHAIEDQGLQFKYVSYSEVEAGELQRHGYHTLVLPDSTSLSAGEVQNIRGFVEAGGVVVADGMPGTFDEHSRRLAASPLADLFDTGKRGPFSTKTYGRGKTIFVNADVRAYLQDRIRGTEEPIHRTMSEVFGAAGSRPEIAVTDSNQHPVVGVGVHTFSNGAVRLLSLQSNPQQGVDELGPPNFRSNKRFEKAQTVQVRLPAMMNVYDLRKKKDLGRLETFTVTLDVYEPNIFALTATPQPHLQVSIPSHADLGSVLPISLSIADTTSAVQVYHVEVLDPGGKRMLQYTDNVIASGGTALKQISLARNDPAGKWTIQTQDMLTGDIETRTVEVQ